MQRVHFPENPMKVLFILAIHYNAPQGVAVAKYSVC
jgi:hypothetical protein